MTSKVSKISGILFLHSVFKSLEDSQKQCTVQPNETYGITIVHFRVGTKVVSKLNLNFSVKQVEETTQSIAT